jgi:hypothetical protein
MATFSRRRVPAGPIRHPKPAAGGKILPPHGAQRAAHADGTTLAC